GGPGGASSHAGRQGRHGEPPLWVGVAPDGVLAVARQGCRLRAEPHRRARRQGAEGSSDRSAWLTRRCASKGRSSGWRGWKQGRNWFLILAASPFPVS